MQRLGQHFLKNKAVLEKIADSLNPKRDDIVIEIGPGHGELTKELLQHPVHVIAIEKDRRLADLLKRNAKLLISNDKSNPNDQMSKLEVQTGNALKILPSLIRNLKLGIGHSNYKVVGNIPYYITGYLLRILSELERKPETITLLIQKEVAERITAKPPHLNLLAAVTQSWAKPTIIARVGKKDFSPPPKVDSAVITLIPRGTHGLPAQAGYPLNPRYFEFLRVLFKQPRKTTANNLAVIYSNKAVISGKLRDLNINPSVRPQNLSLGEIQNLFTALYNLKKR